MPAPLLTGLLRPRLLLPHEQYDGQALAFILRHELVHYRRRDLWYRFILTVANGLHWFNPLVYLLVAQAGTDIEISCDDRVVGGLGHIQRAAYGEAILNTLPIRPKWGMQPMFTTSFGSAAGAIRQRLDNLLENSRKGRGAAAFCAVLVATGIAGGAVAHTPAADVAGEGPAGMQAAMIRGETWYLVKDEAQLRAIAQDAAALSQRYFQDADIRLQEPWTSIGTQAHPFTGTFNGNGYVITGLRYPPGEKECTGLFGYAKGARISNVTLAGLDNTNANGLHSGAVVAVNIGGSSSGNKILSDAEYADRLGSEAGAGAVDTSAILASYYAGQVSPGYRVIKSRMFSRLIGQWTAVSFDGMKNPAWDTQSFARYYILDSGLNPLTAEELYTCTFSAGEDRHGYCVLSYSSSPDGPGLGREEMEETPYPYDLRANLDKIADGLAAMGLDFASATAARVRLADTGQGQASEAILFTDGGGSRYVCYLDSMALEKR